jgi:hypothetical protein
VISALRALLPCGTPPPKLGRAGAPGGGGGGGGPPEGLPNPGSGGGGGGAPGGPVPRDVKPRVLESGRGGGGGGADGAPPLVFGIGGGIGGADGGAILEEAGGGEDKPSAGVFGVAGLESIAERGRGGPIVPNRTEASAAALRPVGRSSELESLSLSLSTTLHSSSSGRTRSGLFPLRGAGRD